MASFADTNIPKFNPYVQQLPVEAMVQVGMDKQKRYEEGVTKIQNQINNIAGMDVMRDVDKNYLQSRLNQLGSDLTTVAAGDFSNFQLVNSVGGMATQISKDKYVQNAVSSTAWYRKQSAEMEKAISEGKSSQANIYDFNKKASQWLGSTDIKESFKDRYTPYTDVFKKLQEIAKSVGEDSTIVQQLFQTDTNGNPILVNGKLQYNDVMAETLLKGKDKNKILLAFQTGLSADDYNQLNLTGKYELQGTSKSDLINMKNENFKDYKKNAILQQEYLDNKILELKTKNGSQKDIDALEQKKVELEDVLNKRSQDNDNLANLDADTLRANIYSSNFMDSVSNGFTTKETYTKYSKNPAVEMMMDREKLKLEVNKAKLEQAKFDYLQRNDANQRAFEWKKALFEKGLIDANGNPTGGNQFAGPGRDINPNDQTNPFYFSEQFDNALTNDLDAQRGLYEKVAVAHWIATNKAANKNYTEAEIREAIGKRAKDLNMTYNDYIVIQGRKTVETFHNDKTSPIGNQFNQDFINISKLEKSIGLKSAKLEEAKNSVKEEAKTQNFKPFDFSKVNIQPVDIDVDIPTQSERGKATGYIKQKLHLSKEDLYNLALIDPLVTGTSLEKPFVSQLAKENAKHANEYLIKKFGNKDAVSAIWRKANVQENGVERLLGLVPFSGVPFKQGSSNPFVELVTNDDFKKTMLLREQYFKNISQVGVPKGVVLYKDKTEAKNHLISTLASVASDYAGADPTYQEITKLANDDKSQFQINIDPAASRYGKNAYSLQVTRPDGTLLTKTITQNQYIDLTGMQAPEFVPSEIESSVNAFSNRTGSTNSTYPYTDPNKAFSTALIKDNETNTKNYNVTIDYAKGSNGNYFPKIYVKVDNDWKLIEYNPGSGFGGYSAQEAEVFPSAIDDNFIHSILIKKELK